MTRLTTREVGGMDDVRSFFDGLASHYTESHGVAGRLLRYRLHVIRRLLDGARRSCLVEIGCGNGLHLFPLASEFETVIGTDLSPRMIAAAEAIRTGHAFGRRIRLSAEPAETLRSVEDDVADVVLCVGAFEHMLDQRAVLKQVARVLKPSGVFVCLTANGSYLGVHAARTAARCSNPSFEHRSVRELCRLARTAGRSQSDLRENRIVAFRARGRHAGLGLAHHGDAGPRRSGLVRFRSARRLLRAGGEAVALDGREQVELMDDHAELTVFELLLPCRVPALELATIDRRSQLALAAYPREQRA